MARLKTLVRNERGVPPLAWRPLALPGLRHPARRAHRARRSTRPVVVVNATGCLEVATTRYPTTAWNVPWIHVAFENAAAVASGIESAQRALRRRGALPPARRSQSSSFAGDGGTYDIGLQALSGALERGHRFLFVCYDNEAYMNTGIQRSGATPFGASTTTSPAGLESFGKAQKRKDMTAIVVAHHIPYVAQAVSSHWHDLSVKVERAVAADGPGVPERAHRLPASAGATSRGVAHQVLDAARRHALLASLRGGRRRVPAELRAGEAAADREVAEARSGSRTCSAPRTPRSSKRSSGASTPTGRHCADRCEAGVPA